MGTDLEWRELIDRSFGDGPEPRPIAVRLDAGRRALRRRRIVVGAVTAVVAVMIGGTAWTALPSESPSGTPPVVGESDDREAGPDDARVASGLDLVTWTDGGWQIAPGWTVVEREPNPMGYQPPRRSVGFDLQNPPYRRLVLAVYDADNADCCTSVASTPAEAGSLEDWLPGAVANQWKLDGEPEPDPVRFGAGETLVAADGVVIHEQLAHPDLPINFVPPNRRSAAARIDDHGREMFVLVREIANHTDVIPFTGSFDTLDQFLRFARQQYASGEGIR